jgi:hypothetical protein
VGTERFLRGLEWLAAAPAFANLDAVARLELEGWDVRRPAVDGEVAVADELSSLGSRRRETHPERDIVESELERTQERFAGHAGVVLGVPEVVAELALEDAVHAPDLLLLTKLEAEVTNLAPTDAVLARG